MYKKIIILSIIFHLIPGVALFPADRLKFEHLFIEDGLSQSSVFDIYQDRQGFFWFGTQDGLNCYDGYSFKVYRADPHDSSAITDNYIQVIREDEFGNMWIGTAGGGLNRFDPGAKV